MKKTIEFHNLFTGTKKHNVLDIIAYNLKSIPTYLGKHAGFRMVEIDGLKYKITTFDVSGEDVWVTLTESTAVSKFEDEYEKETVQNGIDYSYLKCAWEKESVGK